MALTSEQKARVLSLFGNAIVDPKFRLSFFTSPEATCLAYYPNLTTEELARLRGLGTHPYRDQMQSHMNMLSGDIGCPVFPCPDPLDQA